MRDTDALIGELVGNLQPVRPLSFGRGFALAVGAAALSALAVIGLFGLRPDVLSGRFDAVYLLASGLFLMLGLAATVAVIVMSRPQVGNDHSGWVWSAAMTALLPVAALIVAFGRGAQGVDAAVARHGLECLALGSGFAVLVFAVLTGWLRMGAPTSPARAGLVTGVAAGSLGIFAFSLHCADNDIVHIGLWHSAVVVVMAAVGRAIIPRLVRW